MRAVARLDPCQDRPAKRDSRPVPLVARTKPAPASVRSGASIQIRGVGERSGPTRRRCQATLDVGFGFNARRKSSINRFMPSPILTRACQPSNSRARDGSPRKRDTL